MNYILLILLAFGIILLGVIYLHYMMDTRRNNIQKSWNDLDLQLNYRYTLVDKLTNLSFETTKLMEAREKAKSFSAKDMEQKYSSEDYFSSVWDSEITAMGDTKDNPDMTNFQKELEDTNKRIYSATEAYNTSVSEYNSLVENAFIGLIAKMFDMKSAKYFGEYIPKAIQEESQAKNLAEEKYENIKEKIHGFIKKDETAEGATATTAAIATAQENSAPTPAQPQPTQPAPTPTETPVQPSQQPVQNQQPQETPAQPTQPAPTPETPPQPQESPAQPTQPAPTPETPPQPQESPAPTPAPADLPDTPKSPEPKIPNPLEPVAKAKTDDQPEDMGITPRQNNEPNANQPEDLNTPPQ